MAASVKFTPTYVLKIAGWQFPGYSALYALILNLGIAIAATAILQILGVKQAADETEVADYVD